MPTDHELNNYTFRETDTGELVISHNTQGDVLEYDNSTDSISTIKDFDSITTDELAVGDVPSDYHLTLLDEVSGTESVDMDIDVSAYPAKGTRYLIEGTLSGRDGLNETYLTVNNKTDTTYDYTNTTSTSTSGDTKFYLADSEGNRGWTSRWWLSTARNGVVTIFGNGVTANPYTNHILWRGENGDFPSINSIQVFGDDPGGARDETQIRVFVLER